MSVPYLNGLFASALFRSKIYLFVFPFPRHPIIIQFKPASSLVYLIQKAADAALSLPESVAMCILATFGFDSATSQ